MKVEYTEFQLITLARQGDEEALNILLNKYIPVIRKIASMYYVVGCDQQDFIQEGRIAFVRAIETFIETSETSFYSYSMTCVRNRIISSYRRLKRSAGLDQLVDDVGVFKDEYVFRYRQNRSLDDILSEKMIIEEAMSGKEILSEFEKQCFRYYLMDNNYNEIAEILNITPKKVDNALSRSKRKMRKRKNDE